MTRASAEAFRRTITVEWPGATARQLRELLVTTARQGNAETLREQSGRGAPPSVTSYANRPGNSNLESVVLPGPIVYIYDYRREIALAALEALRAASPVESGRYRNSHVMLLNGAQISQAPAMLGAGDVLVLTNPVPYARRIEIGQTESGRRFTIAVPNRIYETVAKKILRQKYREVADIQFGYIQLTGAYQTKGGLSSHYVAKGGARRNRRQRKGAIHAPSITIKALGVTAA